MKMNFILIWLEIRLFPGLPSTQGSACDTAVWLPALKNKRELAKQLLTSGERARELGLIKLICVI